jgi:[acyl-carrier-protein] S-malonyltransferase
MKTAFIFAGQGSQAVGMGKDLYEKYQSFREIYFKTDEVLGMDFSRIILEGPEEVLLKTENTQPAMLAFNVGCFWLLKEEYGIVPDVVTGHSLGEYSALVASGVLDFEDALKLVKVRGLLMEKACPAGAGGMAAVIGLGSEEILALCDEARTRGTVEPANYNCPGQVVIAGDSKALEYAEGVAYNLGAKKVVRLAVSGPFHSSYMSRISEEFAEYLDSVSLQDPVIPFISNVTADYVHSRDEIRKLLVSQLSSCVRWEESMRRLIADGVRKFAEIGPGCVLCSLLKRIDKQVLSQNIVDCKSLEQAVAFLREAD